MVPHFRSQMDRDILSAAWMDVLDGIRYHLHHHLHLHLHHRWKRNREEGHRHYHLPCAAEGVRPCLDSSPASDHSRPRRVVDCWRRMGGHRRAVRTRIVEEDHHHRHQRGLGRRRRRNLRNFHYFRIHHPRGHHHLHRHPRNHRGIRPKGEAVLCSHEIPCETTEAGSCMRVGGRGVV